VAKTEKVDEAQKEEKVEAKEEVKKTESSETAKADTSSRVASELATILGEIRDRIKKLEESPAPSKVVFSKGFVGEEGSEEVKKIETRLTELTQKREKGQLSDKEVDEALDLIKRKKTLTLGLY